MRLVFMLGAVLVGLTGCTDQAGNEMTDGRKAGRYEAYADGTVRQTDRIGLLSGETDPDAIGPNEREEDPVFDEKTAERLEKLAESVQGVNEATCVVLGKVAIIGIDVDGNLDRGKVGTVKYAVAEALSKDPAGVKTAVTADLDIRNRLKGIRDRVEQGRPIRGIAEQFAELIGRVMPQLPRDTAPEAEPQGHPDDRRKVGAGPENGQQQNLSDDKGPSAETPSGQ